MGGTIRFPKVLTFSTSFSAMTLGSRWVLFGSFASQLATNESFFPKLAGDSRSNVCTSILLFSGKNHNIKQA